MPGFQTHHKLDRLIFGKKIADDYAYIHTMLDQPWQKIFSKKHRMFLHDNVTVETIEEIINPVAACVAGWHIALDNAENPNAVIRYLEKLKTPLDNNEGVKKIKRNLGIQKRIVRIETEEVKRTKTVMEILEDFEPPEENILSEGIRRALSKGSEGKEVEIE